MDTCNLTKQILPFNKTKYKKTIPNMMLQTEVPSKFTKNSKQKRTFNKIILTNTFTKKKKEKKRNNNRFYWIRSSLSCLTVLEFHSSLYVEILWSICDPLGVVFNFNLFQIWKLKIGSRAEKISSFPIFAT